MAEKQPGKWRRLPKMSFSSRDLSRRMKKVEGATVKHARRFVVGRWKNIREVRRHIAIWVLAIGVLIGATGVQFFWYQQSYRATAVAEGGTYAEGVLGPVNTLNPIFANTSAEESLSSLLFSRLLSYDTSGNLNYDLAESMTVSEGGRAYTFALRDDALWTDGTRVTSEDVVFTVDLLKDVRTRATVTGWDDITVTAPDDRTVTMTLPDVYAPFPHALNHLPILPEHILREIEPGSLQESAFSQAPVGSGPFSLRFVQDLEQGTGRKIIHLARNDQYYQGAPKLERFQLHVYDNSETLIRGLNTAEINAATDFTVREAESINNERYSFDYRPINTGVYALFNTTSTALEDAQVRRALQLGTDTRELRRSFDGTVPALDLPFLKEQVEGDLPLVPDHDIDRAMELLDEAGWKLEGSTRTKGDETLRLNVVTLKNTDLERSLEVLNEQWRELGVTVTTTIVDPSDPSQNVVQNVLQPRNYDVLIYRLAIGGDPDVYAYWHSSQAGSGLNFSNYSSEASDEALSSARSVIDRELRDAKYVTFARQWVRDVPAIGLYQATSQYAYTAAVHATEQGKRYVNPVDRYSDVLYWTVGDRLVHQTP